jgi:hypothetical protein
MPQDSASLEEIRAILREASAAVGKSDAITASNIASVQARVGDTEGARETLKGLAQNAPVGGAARGLAVQGRISEAIEMVAAISDAQERSAAYWQVAGGLAQASRFAEALAVARLIQNDPDQAPRFIDTLMLIYTAQRKAGDQSGARATVEEAVEFVERQPAVPTGTFDSVPVVVLWEYRPRLYQAIVSAMVRAGDREEARPVVARIQAMAAGERDAEKRKGIAGPLAYAQADMGDFDAALETAAAIGSELTGDVVLGEIADEQARQGDAAGALRTAQSLKNSFSALQQIERTLADRGDFTNARAAVDLMSGPGERAAGLADLAFQQADKSPGEAKTTADLAWQEAQKARGEAPAYVYGNAVEFIAAARARMGDIDGAMAIVKGDPGLQNQLWPLQNVVQRLVTEGRNGEALKLARSQAQARIRASLLETVASSLLYRIQPMGN